MHVSRGLRFGAVFAATAVAMTLGATPASAHDSQYCEHSRVDGTHWSIDYYDYYNRQRNGSGSAYNHYHDVDHYYRRDANDDYYFHRHQHRHYCGGSGGVGRSSGETLHVPGYTVTEPGPPVETPVHAEVGAKIDTADAIVTSGIQNGLAAASYCAQQIWEYRNPFCLILSRRGAADVQLVLLSGSVVESVGLTGERVASVPAGSCILSATRMRSASRRPAFKVELADSALAARLGHSC